MSGRRAFLRRVAGFGLTVTAGCVAGNGGRSRAQQTANRTVTTTGTPTNATGTRTGTAGTNTAGGTVVDVAVGPEGRLRFDPETVEIVVGDVVRWTFESPGHNVTSKPGASEKVRTPEGAEPFASYEGNQHYAIDEVGSTYEHTFTVPGEYVYVCEPHADQGMVGTVVVTGRTATSTTSLPRRPPLAVTTGQ